MNNRTFERIGPSEGGLPSSGPAKTALFLGLWLVAPVFFGLCCSPVVAEQASANAPASAAPSAPAIVEWLNQPVRLRQTVQAVIRPSEDAPSAGTIRAGAEVKAVGVAAGKHWVEIELPDHSQAYVPREAIEYEPEPALPGENRSGPAPASAAAAPQSSPAGADGAPPKPGEATAPQLAPVSAPGAVRGKVTRVPNAATLVVGDQRLRLSGIDPGPIEDLGPFGSWVRAQGELVCMPEAQTGRYRCLTGSGVDVAQAAILNGTGRVGDGAEPEYRDSETQARDGKRGLWAQP
jgi:endonuclease YncB( thermonuclease family)